MLGRRTGHRRCRACLFCSALCARLHVALPCFRFYLCLFSGPSTSLPKGLTESQDADQATESAFTSERAPHKKARRDLVKKSREWVLEKKERRRRQGKEVRPDTQYTGRKRKPRF